MIASWYQSGSSSRAEATDSVAEATDATASVRMVGGCVSTAISFSGVAIIEPRLGSVRIAADFPESLVVIREEFDLPDPLRALPGVELRCDHPARTPVLAR